MTTWDVILIASAAVLLLKITGYLVPPRLLERPRPTRISGLLTIALLAGLVSTQTIGAGQGVQFDARVPAVVLAGILFALRVPFILVIIAAAVAAALLRLWM